MNRPRRSYIFAGGVKVHPPSVKSRAHTELSRTRWTSIISAVKSRCNETVEATKNTRVMSRLRWNTSSRERWLLVYTPGQKHNLIGRWRRSITRHRSSLSKNVGLRRRKESLRRKDCGRRRGRERGGGGEVCEQETRREGGGVGRAGRERSRTWIGTGLRLALHSFACRELSYNYLSACNGSTGIATANATTG